MCLFLLINIVFMLNLVVAIMSNAFAYLDEVKNGLYYNVLINQFPVFEWDERYGAIVCAQSPFNILLPLMVPTFMLPCLSD